LIFSAIAHLLITRISDDEATPAMVGGVERPRWDPNKDRENRAKHGIGFDEATEAVADPLSRPWPNADESRDEQRFIIVGESTRGRMLIVVITLDIEGKMRIISARRATKRERHAYEDF
jgi:uncharacterized DUF497 family protein